MVSTVVDNIGKAPHREHETQGEAWGERTPPCGRFSGMASARAPASSWAYSPSSPLALSQKMFAIRI